MNRSRSLPASCVVLLLAACQTPALHPNLPPALAMAPGERLVGTLSAQGVQIYECRTDAAGRSGWAFVAPEAELLDRDGRPAGRHGAGPFWQAPDGSRVEGRVLARSEAPAAGAVPWLLLETRSTGGDGALAEVTRIRRVRTSGGAAPETPCDAGLAGTRARVGYAADYLLSTSR